MGTTVKDILNDIRTAGAGVPVQTITYVGLLLERASQSRYDDPMYPRLTFPLEWLPLRLTEADVAEIVDVLADVLDRHPSLASTAAWALGKAFSDRAVPRLRAAMERYVDLADETTYQVLVAIDNHGFEECREVVDRVAHDGPPKSREFARELEAAHRRLVR